MMHAQLMADASHPSGSGGPAGELDLEAALARVGGHVDLLKELVALFIDDYPNSLNDILAGVRERDAPRLERSAHSLKGSVSNFGAPGIWTLAAELERKGRAADWNGVPELVKHLEERLERLKKEMLAL